MDVQPHSTYSTYGHLGYDEDSDTLQCHVCGRLYRNLAQHARRSHGLAADEYREMAGLNRQTKLITPSMRERIGRDSRPLIARLRCEGKLRNWAEDADKWRRDKASAVLSIREGTRQEGRNNRKAGFSEGRRRELSERRTERNLAGLDRAGSEAISKGLRRSAGGPRPCERCGQEYQLSVPRQRYCEPCREIIARERWRDSARRRRLRRKLGEDAAPRRANPLARDQSRDASCKRCGETFRGASHRNLYCLDCRPVHDREYSRDWKRAKRKEEVSKA